MRTWVAVLVLAAGCASAPIRPADQIRLADADARVLDGCYTCLIEARETFEQIATGRARPLVIQRLFEVNILIGLRESELAMDPVDAFSRAEALLPELPLAVNGSLHLSIARAIPPDPVGTPRAETRALAPQLRATAEQVPDLEAQLGTAQVSEPFRDYLAASLRCVLGLAGGRYWADAPAPEIPANAPPLVVYRMATCPILRPDALGTVMDAVPAFVDAGVYRARLPSLNVTAEYVVNNRAWLMAARERFPRSPAIHYALGVLHQLIGHCGAAIDFYDAALGLQPAHEDSALQRAICLGYLRQHDAAITAATHIIEADYDVASEGYYWRAWNQYHLQHLTEARADIDRARAMLVNARVLTLGGMIKYSQQELDLAESDFQGAIQMDRAACVPHWYLALIQFQRQHWAATGDAFWAATECYDRSATNSERRLATMREADLDPEYKAVQMAGLEAAIAEDRAQEQASCLNAAYGFARSGNHQRALTSLARLPPDSPHTADANQLREYLERAASGQ